MDKGNKVSYLYGRARRIEFAEKLAYMFVGIVAVSLVFYMVSQQNSLVDRNEKFTYLREYLEQKGYNCAILHTDGGQCILTNDVSNYNFIRYNTGFEYIVRTKSYVLDIKHVLTEEDSITFKTYSDAFAGYRNKEYICSYDDSVVGELNNCFTEDGQELDLGAYKGLIKGSMHELNNILDSSGYNKKKLINDYEWIKK